MAGTDIANRSLGQQELTLGARVFDGLRSVADTSTLALGPELTLHDVPPFTPIMIFARTDARWTPAPSTPQCMVVGVRITASDGTSSGAASEILMMWCGQSSSWQTRWTNPASYENGPGTPAGALVVYKPAVDMGGTVRLRLTYQCVHGDPGGSCSFKDGLLWAYPLSAP